MIRTLSPVHASYSRNTRCTIELPGISWARTKELPMTMFKFLAAAAAVGGVAAPLAAQSPYPYAQNYPQPYPGQPGYGYQQGYSSGYGNQGGIGQIIDQLLGGGNRYSVSDRTAVSQCANAAM